MKKILFVIGILFHGIFINAQSPNPTVEGLIEQTNLDSLVKYVNELTGEVPVIVNGSPVTIQHRVSSMGNDLAADYLVQKLESFGLSVTDQQYSTDGRNIFATQTGIVYPNEKFIICAHYDAVADYCADDNASGTSAVLEAARLLSQQDFPYTIIYALWDEEEIGLIGSGYYADQAAANGDVINGVINLEMFGWDSNDDGLYDIHTDNIANSVELAQAIVNVDETYELNLSQVTYNPGTGSSDHSSFWNNGYGAVVFSEAFFGGDSNPYYHTSSDRISEFNLPYFHELSKLAVGTIVTLALGDEAPAPVATFAPEDGAVDVAVDQPVVVTFNTPVRKLDDAGITDPSEFIEFKLGSPISDDVPFSASINAEKTVFTITPDEEMNYNQQYYVEISDQIENENNIQFEGASITFTTLDNTGVDQFIAADLNVYPNPVEGVLTMQLPKELADKVKVTIQDLSGIEIYTFSFEDSQHIGMNLSDLSSGMYLLAIELKNYTLTKKISKI